MARTRLQAVGEEEAALIGDETPAEAREPRGQSALTGLLLTSLRALSQRTVVALASLVDLMLIGSAFALWLMVIASPTNLQLVGLAGYALFVLCAIYMRR